MKGKFRLMWRVGLALVLALSLSLVMAAPVSAAVSEPEVTVAPTTPADTTAVYTIEFTTNEDLASGDAINIEFPTGTDITAITDAVDADVTVNTVQHASAQVGQRLSITLGAALEAGDITVVVGTTNNVTNPADGDYTLEVYTSQEPTAVTSETYTISVAVTVFTPVVPTPATVGAAATYAITFTTSEDLRIGDAIVIEFPVDTDISAVVAGDVTGVTAPSTSVVGQVLTITLGGDLSAGAQTVTIANHIINPTTLYNPDPLTNEWKLTLYTTYGHRIPALSAAYALSAGTTISQVGWSTVDEYVPNATPSDAFVIQTQTQYGNAAVVASDVTFTLTASSGAFYSDSGCGAGTVITTIIIADTDSESAAFYYKGATAGTVTITADELVSQGWTVAEDTILVNPELELWGGGELKDSYATFALAIADALPYDTIKVAASTYEENFTVSGPYLTIESTAGKATTIIEGTLVLSGSADNFVLGGATGKGFTIKGTDPLISLVTGADNVEISYNAFDTTTGSGSRAITTNPGNVAGLTVSHNTFTLADLYDQGIRSSVGDTITEWTITDNVFTGAYPTTADQSAIEIPKLDITDAAKDTVISGNIFTTVNNGVIIGNDSGGGLVSDDAPGKLEISGNTFDGCKYGIDLVNAATNTDVHDVRIEQNTFSTNTYGLAINYGDYPNATDLWNPEEFTVKYNDFSGNTYGIYNAADDTTDLPAENNYWGSVTGPTITANVGGTGDRVSTQVDYSPWLNASGGGATSTDTITLVTGWNLISLPLLPTDSDIDTVLAGADVTVNKVAYFTGGPAGTWKSWFPSPTPSDLYTMNDGKGYWIDVSAAGELTVTGFELALPGYAPPTYDVVVGWNLIGFTSTAAKTVNVYLGSVFDTVEAMYKYDAATGLYTAVLTSQDLASGQGYWLAVNAAGKIYP